MLTDVALIWKQSKVCMFVSKVYTAIRIKSGRTSPALPYWLHGMHNNKRDDVITRSIGQNVETFPNGSTHKYTQT